MKNEFNFRNGYEGVLQFVATSYLAYRIKSANVESLSKTQIKEVCASIDDADIRMFITEKADFEIVSSMCELEIDELKANVLNYDFETLGRELEITPKSVCDLAVKILDVSDNERVLDACSGIGTFIRRAYQVQSNANYYGIDINKKIVILSKILAEFEGVSCGFKEGNFLINDADEETFDKAFSNCPIGIRVRDVYYENDIYELQPCLSKASSAIWLFNYKLAKAIKKSGKAVAVMNVGALWNTSDFGARELFVKERKVQAVIKLPQRLFSTFGIQTALIVLGKNNGNICFVDASNEYEEGRRQNIMTSENIDNVIKALENETEISRFVSINEVEECNYSFDPTRYLEKQAEIKNGIPFGSIIKNITRGVGYSAKELDELSSSEPTDCQYVMLANIKNGVIDEELPYLKEIPEKCDKYCIKKGNLLLSKNGYPFKVAVVGDIDKKILANGNLYIIELDERKVNPYYIKAYLESELGTAQLKSITVGASIPNIGVSQLNTILIPMISIEEQNKIVEEYLGILSRIEELRNEIEGLEESLKTVFDKKF